MSITPNADQVTNMQAVPLPQIAITPNADWLVTCTGYVRVTGGGSALEPQGQTSRRSVYNGNYYDVQLVGVVITIVIAMVHGVVYSSLALTQLTQLTVSCDSPCMSRDPYDPITGSFVTVHNAWGSRDMQGANQSTPHHVPQ